MPRTMLVGPQGADVEATFKWIEERLKVIEDHIWPPPADGSGTERYDNWTQTGDGTQYPGSYGVGEPKPFVPFDETKDPIVVGDSVRIITAAGEVDPAVHKVSGVSTAGEVFVEGDEHPHHRDAVVRVIPA